MQFKVYRSTYVEQLAAIKASIAKHQTRYMVAQALLAAEQERRVPSYEVLIDCRQRMGAALSLMRASSEHYTDLVRFHTHCERIKLEQKVASESAIYADWAAHGLPTGRA